MELQPLPSEAHPNFAGSLEGRVEPATTSHPLLWVSAAGVWVLVCVLVLWWRRRP